MIAILDYDMGNIGSIANMLRHIGAECTVTSDPGALRDAKGLILPGVGAFDEGMDRLRDRGLKSVLDRLALAERKPILGICLGAQLMTRSSEEGRLPGLGWIAADTRRFRAQPGMRIPHMGWNHVEIQRAHPLWACLRPGARFYFVHSYHLVCDDPADVLCQTDYGGPFTSAIGRDNILGVQFHPEKSHRYGMELLRGFVQHCQG
jgi:glutamine amidotransferase